MIGYLFLLAAWSLVMFVLGTLVRQKRQRFLH